MTVFLRDSYFQLFHRGFCGTQLQLSLELKRTEANYFVDFFLCDVKDIHYVFIFKIWAGINAILGSISMSPSIAVWSDIGKLYSKIAFCINRCLTHIMGFLSDWAQVLFGFLRMQEQISSACFCGHTRKQEYQSRLSCGEFMHANVKVIRRKCYIRCTCPDFSSDQYSCWFF